MAYFKKTWQPGNKVTTTELNRIETGVDDITKQAVKTVNNTPPDANGNVLVTAPVGSADWAALTNKPTFATVATSGDFNDLANKPTIPAPFTLPIATETVLGGIMAGSGVTIDPDGKLNAGNGGSTSVPISYILKADLTTLAPGTYAVCTDTNEAFMGTALGNIGPLPITAPTSNGGGGGPVTPTVIVSDGFTRGTDSPTSVGSTDSVDGGTSKVWAAITGTTMGTIGGQLYNSSTSGAASYVNAGVSDAKMVVYVSVVGNEHDFYFRVDPTSKNYLRYAHNGANGGTWYLQEQNGTFTTITSFPGSLTANDVITIEAVGSTVKLYQNGTVIHTANALTDLQTFTGFGLGFSGSAAGRVDKVDIYNLSGTGGSGSGDITAPVLTITPAGTFTGTKTITMSTDETADIFYTTNGTTPSVTGGVPNAGTTKYTASFSVSSTTTVKAYAVDTSGNVSAIQTIIYTLATSTVTPRPTNFVLVTDYGAKGDGSTTDNTSIQNAVNAAVAAGKAVIVNVSAAGGTYLIDSNNGINLPSNTTIYFDSGAKFIEKAGTTNSVPKIINSLNASNINIIAPVIVGDRNYHTTPAGEYGMGLYIRSCTNVYIENPNISNCWGDAVYLGDGGGAQTWCENVTIKNANFNNNRRQGISVISVKGLQILDPIITNTNGTDPQCGIDFEPNTTSQFLQGITVTNPFIQNNAQHGIHVWIGFGPGANPIDITVTNAVNVKNNLKGNYYVGGSNSSTKGYIKIDGTYYLNK